MLWILVVNLGLCSKVFRRSIRYSQSLYESIKVTQGSTFDTALVDVDDIVFDKNGVVYADCEEVNRRLYVAASRCRNKLYLKFSK